MRECLSKYHVINIKSENESFFPSKDMLISLHKMGEIVYVNMSWYNIHVIIKKLIVKRLKTPILLQWNFKFYV